MRWFDRLPSGGQAKLEALLQHPRADHIRRYADGDRAYGCWLLVAEVRCRAMQRIGIFDLADAPWHAWYRDDVAPETALAMALRADGLFAE